MKSHDLHCIETELGIDLPAEYRDFMLEYRPARGDLGKLPLPLAMLRSWIVTQAGRLIRLNENVADGEPLAGLRRWPDSYFIFGDDGSGNYLILDTRARRSSVLEYDHERDDLRRKARDFGAFIGRLLSGREQEDVLIHSGRRPRRSLGPKTAWRPPKLSFSRRSPKWQTDWMAFVDEFTFLVKGSKTDSQRIARANRRFASKAVRWEGRVESLRLNEYASAVIELEPAERAVAGKLLRFGRVAIGLRIEARSSARQIITSLPSWKGVRVGDQVRFVMMIAPGLRDEPPGCVDIVGPYDGVHWVELQDCGGHLVKVLSKTRRQIGRAMRPNTSLERTRDR